MGRTRIRTRDAIVYALAVGLVFLLVGILIGEAIALSVMVDLGFKLLSAKKIDINIDEARIRDGIWKYENQVRALGG